MILILIVIYLALTTDNNPGTGGTHCGRLAEATLTWRVATSRYEYTIILHPDIDEGGYTVTVPALPGCVTQGETIEEAIAIV